MLSELLSLDVYRFFMIFARLASFLMTLPGFGGRLVATRIRLILALTFAALMMPLLAPMIPPRPASVGHLLLLVLGEVSVGVFLGMIVQTLMATLNVAGTVLSFQVGISNAFSFDAIAEQQGQLLTSMLTNLGLLVLFTTDLHHLMLRAVVDSYGLFVPGEPLPLNDFSETLTKTLTGSFDLGVRLAAPLIVFGLVFYAGLGLLSRLVPSIQVFFVGLPIQVLLGMWLLAVTLPSITFLFARWFENGLLPLTVPR